MKPRHPAIVIGLLVAGTGMRAESPLQRAPAKASIKKNPLEGRDDARRAGEKLFARECAACHGSNAEGQKGPPLRERNVSEAQPGAIFWVLRNGSLWRGMPSFAHLPEPQRWQIVTYLQSLTP